MNPARAFAIVMSLILISIAGSSLTLGADKKITRKEIPAAVLKAFEAQYPHATITGQSIETELGKQLYEIESTDGKVDRDLLYTPSGKVVETEESLPPGKLSEAMKSSLAKEYPDGKIMKAEKVTREAKTSYEIQVQVGTKTREVTLDASGEVVKPSKKTSENDENGEKDDDDDDDDDGV